VRVPVSRKAPPPAPAPTPENATPAAGAPPERAPSPFNRHFQAPRQAKRPAAPSGRVLPPAPAWMQKPLKPPRAQSSGSGN